MRWFTIAVVVLAGLLSWSPTARTEKGSMDQLLIFYFPFNEDTYVPITRDSIEEEAICKLTLPGSSDQARRLRQAFEAAKTGPFDNSAVRLKVIGLLQDVIYADVDGGLFYERTSSERKMAQDHFNDVKSLMARLAEQQGCD